MMQHAKQLLQAHKQLRYLVSGVVSEIAEYATFAALLAVTNALLFANSVGFMVGITVGFVLHKLWSFAGEQQFKTHQQAVAYGILAIFNFLMSNILLSLLVNGIGVAALIAKPITMIMIAAWSFVVFNFVIFKQRG